MGLLKTAIGICVGLSITGGAIYRSDAQTSTYPTKPVTLTVGYAPGGSTDLATRTLAHEMEKLWGKPVVIVNKPGASTAIQMEYVKHSPPDGYTLGVFVTGGMTATALREVPYHFFNDFTHIAQFATFILGVQVNPDSPWMTLKDLVEYGHKSPGKLRYCAVTAGTSSHLLAEQFAYMNNLKWVYVPVDSDSQITPALLGKHVDLGFISVPGFKPFVQAKKLRLLAVFHESRLQDFPDVPTLKETGYQSGGLEDSFVFGIFGPKQLPKEIVENVSSVVKTALKNPEVIKVIESQGSSPKYRDGDEWVSFLKKEDEKVINLMNRIGLKVIRGAYK